MLLLVVDRAAKEEAATVVAGTRSNNDPLETTFTWVIFTTWPYISQYVKIYLLTYDYSQTAVLCCNSTAIDLKTVGRHHDGVEQHFALCGTLHWPLNNHIRWLLWQWSLSRSISITFPDLEWFSQLSTSSNLNVWISDHQSTWVKTCALSSDDVVVPVAVRCLRRLIRVETHQIPDYVAYDGEYLSVWSFPGQFQDFEVHLS